MWALNSAHNYCYQNNTKVTLEFHWEHEKDHLHHFEDPETIIERLEYIHNFYHRKDDVTVVHVYGERTRYSDWKFDDDVVLEEDGSRRIKAIERKGKNRFWFSSGAYTDGDGDRAPVNDWIFREDAFRKIDKRKVVIWRPTFNAEVPRTWKRSLTHKNWDAIISSMRGKGLYVVELTYRTPVSEAFYHISTCRQVICYDGMWHYIARNFAIPMVVLSSEGITSYHTPHCIKTNKKKDNPRNIYYWMSNFADMLGKSKRKAVEYERKLRQFYDGGSHS
jgi:hypothetical protein